MLYGPVGMFRSVRVDLSENPFPRFATVIDFWENRRKARFAPTLREISLMDLGGKIVPQCAVVDVSQDPPGFRYRFFGTGLVDLYGAELTGRTPHDNEPSGVGWLCTAQYAEVVASREPRFFISYTPTRIGGARPSNFLRLPLADEHGDAVSHILTVEDISEDWEHLGGYYRALGLENCSTTWRHH
jgi:hypothetical protein